MIAAIILLFVGKSSANFLYKNTRFINGKMARFEIEFKSQYINEW